MSPFTEFAPAEGVRAAGPEWQVWMRLVRILHQHRNWEDFCAALGRGLGTMTGAQRVTLYRQTRMAGSETEALLGPPIPLPSQLPDGVGKLLIRSPQIYVQLYSGPTQSLWLALTEPGRANLEAVLPHVARELGQLLADLGNFQLARLRLIERLATVGEQASGSAEQLLPGLAEALNYALDGLPVLALADEGAARPRAFVSTSSVEGVKVSTLDDDELCALTIEAMHEQRHLILRRGLAARLGQLVSPEQSMFDWLYLLPLDAGEHFTGLIGVALPGPEGYPESSGHEVVTRGQDVSGWPRVSTRTAVQAEAMNLLRSLSFEFDEFLDRRTLQENAYVAGLQHESSFLGLDLHDSILQDFSYLQLQLGRLENMLPAESDQARALLHQLQAHVTSTSQSARELSLGLSNANTSTDLAEMLEEVVDRFKRRFDGELEMVIAGDPRHVGARVALQTRRIVQETLNNVWKHAQAQRVVVSVHYDIKGIQLVVKDDGRGFSPERAGPDSLGLRGMHQRVADMGGVLQVDTSPGKGTTVNLHIPA